MEGPLKDERPRDTELLGRETLCLPDFNRDTVLHGGDPGFEDALQQYFSSPESNCAERLVRLKTQLETANTQEFWTILMEEICDITGAQCGFVAKRMIVEDENAAVEMPPLGEPGSCLMGVAFYLNNGTDVKEHYKDYRYHAYGSPCAHMKHDKVFVIPERMHEVIPNNPNKLPWKQSEAFIGLPLFTEGKCFAHFGMIWSREGARRRPPLSWAYIEMFLHSLEDMIKKRILEGRGFAKEQEPDSMASRIIPLSAITASQSLKPYARSLSHELRTPMQGVIGLLDVMHYTVMDAIAAQENDGVKDIFQSLKDSIEQIQDSSKRAVEAADNVVHAYDNNMQMPDTPLSNDGDLHSRHNSIDEKSTRPSVIEGAGIPISPNQKRHREESIDFHPGPPMKRLARASRTSPLSLQKGNVQLEEYPFPASASDGVSSVAGTLDAATAREVESAATHLVNAVFSSAHRHLSTRDFMHRLVNEALVSSHPVEKLSRKTEHGEVISVKMRGAKGEIESLDIEVHVHPDVPHTIVTEEQHLQFSLQKVIDNAIKFTLNGFVTIHVSMARSAQLLEFRVVDTGCGITSRSKSLLFSPHFQQDNSIARRRDGLGLSLFNAKAHVRKDLGGDMTLERSDTTGPTQGSEFLIRIPLLPSPDAARPDTPLVGTPKPGSRVSRAASPMISSHPIGSGLAPPPTSAPRGPSPVPVPSPLLKKSSIKLGSGSRTSKKVEYNRELASEIPLNILVAEDNEINRNLLVTFLHRLGYEKAKILKAADGLDAVKHFRDNYLKPASERINCVLMDLWMPNMDGYEATEKIFQFADQTGCGRDSVAVMAVTADITNEAVERADKLGMRGFMSKPYKIKDVEMLLVEHFGRVYG